MSNNLLIPLIPIDLAMKELKTTINNIKCYIAAECPHIPLFMGNASDTDFMGINKDIRKLEDEISKIKNSINNLNYRIFGAIL